MKRITWYSTRPTPTMDQLEEINRLWPGHSLTINIGHQNLDARQIINHFNENEGDEMICVVPLSVFKALTCEGMQPIKAEMEFSGVRDDGGPSYRFIRFIRIVDVILRTKQLSPELPQQEVKDLKEVPPK